MQPRFHLNAFSSSSSGTQTPDRQEPACRCCLARERALALAIFDSLPEWRSPLTPGVQTANFTPDHDTATLWVNLSDDWPRLFRQLPAVGPGLVMSRNEAAILSSRRSYPALYFTAQQTKCANAEAGLWLDCRALGRAKALHARRECGNLFGVEWTDANGRLAHRLTLTPESDLDEFCGWVRLHQACALPAATAAVEAPFTDEPDHAQTTDAGALLAVINACVQHEIAIRATVFAGIARQRATFLPRSLQFSDEWWFASDDMTGLHFHTGCFTRVSVSPPLDAEFHAIPVLLAATADHAPALMLELGDPTRTTDWNAINHGLI